jgi:hypothetical protein
MDFLLKYIFRQNQMHVSVQTSILQLSDNNRCLVIQLNSDMHFQICVDPIG